jgi:hypothetical protein
MQKVAVFGALTALFFLVPQTTPAQTADEVERLRRENELLKKEIELLKREIELLKKEAKGKPDTGPRTGPQARTKASLTGVDYELVKCVRDPRNPTRVIFAFSAQCDMVDVVLGGGPGQFRAFYLHPTARGGEALKGQVKEGPPGLVRLTKGVPSKFQLTYEGVDEDITQFDEVALGESNVRREVKFYNIKIDNLKIEPK